MIVGVQADNPHLTLVVNPAVGYDYFLPSPRLPSQLQSVTAVGRYRFLLHGEQRHVWATCL